jgi:predicted RND superfamily exporter protein
VASDEDKPVGLLARCLGGIVGFGARRPRLALWVMVLLGCASVGLTYSELQLQTSRARLLGPQDSWEAYRAFGGDSEMVVVVRNDQPDAVLLQTVLDRLGDRLQHDEEHFKNVFYRFDQSVLQKKALQRLSSDELQSAIRRVEQFGPVLANERWDLLRVERLAATLDSRIRRAQQEQTDPRSAIEYAQRLSNSLGQFLQVDDGDVRLNAQGFRSPWPEMISAAVAPSVQTAAGDRSLAYLMNADRSVGLLYVQAVPAEGQTSFDPEAVVRLREHLGAVYDSLEGAAPNLDLAATGIPVLEYDELQRSQTDIWHAGLVALVAVCVLLGFGLRGIRHPMLVVLMLINALAITFGVATLVVGHLNVLSICFIAIVIGLGVDFGIHFVSRYLFLRQELYELEESLELAAQSVGGGILTSALTTSIAFGSAALTGYPALAELGLVTAGGILVCAFLTFSFLPALIALADQPVEVDQLPVPVSGDFWRSTVAGYPLSAISLGALIIFGVAVNALNVSDGSFDLKVGYDANLLNLQDRSAESVQAERTLAAVDESLLYAVAIADSPEQARELSSQLAKLPSVGRVTDISSQLPATPSAEQQQLIGRLRNSLSGIPRRNPEFSKANFENVGRSLDGLFKTLSASTSPVAQDAAGKLDQFLNRFASLSASQQSATAEAYQNLMVSSLLEEFDEISRASSTEPMQLSDLPEAWRRRHLHQSESGPQFLIRVYPKADVWDDAALAAFVNDVRTIAPDATGAPIQNYDSAVRMQECYQSIALYAVVAITLFLLFDFLRPGQKLLTLLSPMLVVGCIGYVAVQRQNPLQLNVLLGVYVAMVAFIAMVFDFRNLRDTLIATIPAIGGLVMMLGLMALLQVDFNPINLVALPLVLGIGVDDGIHLVHDYRRQLKAGADEYKPSGETLNGVLLTSLTSVIGFGSLMIAAHAGLKTMGIVLALGVTCCLAVALLLLPPILVLVARHQPASFEPVILRRPKAESDEDDSSEDGDDQQGRRLSRKERRRQQQNAA